MGLIHQHMFLAFPWLSKLLQFHQYILVVFQMQHSYQHSKKELVYSCMLGFYHLCTLLVQLFLLSSKLIHQLQLLF